MLLLCRTLYYHSCAESVPYYFSTWSRWQTLSPAPGFYITLGLYMWASALFFTMLFPCTSFIFPQSKTEPFSQGEYNVYSTFQSHEPEFDYLKSLEIEEKINKIRWLPQQNAAHFLLSTNGERLDTHACTLEQTGRYGSSHELGWYLVGKHFTWISLNKNVF